MKFWDSSAVVPLIVQEPETSAIRALLAEDADMLVWAMTPLEVTSALWRRVRSGSLDEHARAAAAAGLADLEDAWHTAADLVQVVARARRLLAVHPLRAADAAQLAAALLTCRERTDTIGFVSLDERLCDAARREGFALHPAR